MAVFSTISTFEKSVVRNALYSNLTQLMYIPSTTLFYTLVDLLKHKARCRCPTCSPKVEEVMAIAKTIPLIPDHSCKIQQASTQQLTNRE